MTVRLKDYLVYGFIVLVCLAFLGWVIPTYTPAYPGYGVPTSLLPNVSVGIILALALLGLVRNALAHWALKKAKTAEAPAIIGEFDRVHLLHLGRFFIPCVLLMPAMKWIGFIPAGLVFMLLIQYLCGQRKPIPMVLVAVISVGILYVAMRFGLGAPMP